jgi:branched-chain amino acid transport system substrate-binding protein
MVARVLAIGLVFAFGAVMIAPAAADEAPYAIPVILSLSGPAAFLGKEQADALRLLETEVNRHGGIRGTPIHFDVADDQTSPQVAVQLANAIVAQQKPMILGASVVGTCAAVSAVAKSGPVAYCLSPGLHPDPGSFAFSAGVSTYDIFKVALRYFRLSGRTRIAVLSATDATGQDGDRALDAAAQLPENHAIALVDREHVAPGDVSVSAQLAHIKQSNPDVVILFATGTAFGTMLRGYADSGMSQPVFTSTGNMTYAQMGQADRFGVPLYFVGLRFFDAARIGRGPLHDAVHSFDDAFKAIGVRPDIGDGLAWDPGLLVVAALRAYGTSLTAAQLRDFIGSQRSFVGINGLYNFPGVPQRGINDLAAVMAHWDSPSKSFAVVSKPGGVPR